MSRPWIQLQPLDRANPTALFTVMCYNVLCDRWLQFHCSFFMFLLTSKQINYLFADEYSNLCAQVCNAQPLWLLPTVGSKLGVQVEQKRLRTFFFESPNLQEERHFGRGASLCSGHHCHARG